MSAHQEQAASDDQNCPALILLAEDNKINAVTLIHSLTMHGYEVIHASDGREAFEMAQKKRPDLIIMDIQLPIMNGLEVIRRLKDNVALHHIPIIALTAVALAGDKNRCLEAGADAYLSKPTRLEDLTNLIKKHLSQPPA